MMPALAERVRLVNNFSILRSRLAGYSVIGLVHVRLVSKRIKKTAPNCMRNSEQERISFSIDCFLFCGVFFACCNERKFHSKTKGVPIFHSNFSFS